METMGLDVARAARVSSQLVVAPCCATGRWRSIGEVSDGEGIDASADSAAVLALLSAEAAADSTAAMPTVANEDRNGAVALHVLWITGEVQTLLPALRQGGAAGLGGVVEPPVSWVPHWSHYALHLRLLRLLAATLAVSPAMFGAQFRDQDAVRSTVASVLHLALAAVVAWCSYLRQVPDVNAAALREIANAMTGVGCALHLDLGSGDQGPALREAHALPFCTSHVIPLLEHTAMLATATLRCNSDTSTTAGDVWKSLGTLYDACGWNNSAAAVKARLYAVNPADAHAGDLPLPLHL
jgi:hypothetical protein